MDGADTLRRWILVKINVSPCPELCLPPIPAGPASTELGELFYCFWERGVEFPSFLPPSLPSLLFSFFLPFLQGLCAYQTQSETERDKALLGGGCPQSPLLRFSTWGMYTRALDVSRTAGAGFKPWLATWDPAP